jgi:hypothetical protein
MPCADPLILKKSFQLLLAILGCLHLIGGPYAAIQVFAWSTMLVDYSNQDGFAQGFQDTFSGEKPCSLCKKIESVKQTEHEDKVPLTSPSQLSSKMLREMIPVADLVVLPPHGVIVPSVAFADAALFAGIGPDAPPIPPPCRLA